MQKTWCVSKEDAGIKLQTYLRAKFGLSLRLIRQALEQNSCQVNGAIERFGSTPLKTGDQILFCDATKSKPTEIDQSRILFEDEAILVYNKPPYLSCDKQGIAALFPQFKLVHRLDRDTTGVLLLAKTPKIAQALTAQFAKRLVKKEYLALVDGVPSKNAGYCESLLAKKHWYQGQTTYGSANKGVLAKTHWKVEKKGKNASLLCVTPLTGRTHQIRVHLKELGHPLLGDRQYADKFVCAYVPGRYMLHAHTLTFFHPLTKEKLQFKAPLPKDFKEGLKCAF